MSVRVRLRKKNKAFRGCKLLKLTLKRVKIRFIFLVYKGLFAFCKLCR